MTTATSSLDLLITSDLHAGEADQAYPFEAHQCPPDVLFLRKALQRLRYTGVEADLVMMLRNENASRYPIPVTCKPPFRFVHARFREDSQVEAEEHALRMETPGLVDTHCHTEYAYCAANVNGEINIALSKALGLDGLCLIEHAFQLYFDEDEAWSYRWQTDEALVQQARKMGRGRMPEYRRFAHSLRERHAGFVRVGLEVDLGVGGELLLFPEDRAGWDLLVGAVHAIPAFEKDRTSQAQAEKLFLRQTERLLAQPIHVLAHPFRFFRRAGLERPPQLYEPVAEMLAQSGVAAEVNFHSNEPDPRFVAECLSRGVKIALATDSHTLTEVGELYPHLELLRRVGIQDEELPNVLYRPGKP